MTTRASESSASPLSSILTSAKQLLKEYGREMDTHPEEPCGCRDHRTVTTLCDLLSAVQQLQRDLRTYGQHTSKCRLSPNVLASTANRKCSCGLSKALAGEFSATLLEKAPEVSR